MKVAPHETFKGPQSIRIEASVTDVNRQVVAGRTSVKVHPGSFYIGMRREQYLVESGKPMELKLVAVGLDGKQLAGRNIKVELARREWRSTRKQAAGGGTTWVSETVDQVKHTCNTRSQGIGAARCSFTIPEPGYYVFKASSKDKAGHAITTSESLYAWGGGYFWWGRDDDERIELIADKQTYAIGDTARIMVKSPFRQAQALVTVERRGVLEQKVVPIKGSAQTISVPVTEDFMPNAYVSVVLVRGRVDNPDKDAPGVDPGKPAYKMGYASLKVDSSQQILQVSVEAEQEIYEPGETVHARIDLKDALGQPVAGEVTFMAVDEGVLSLTGYKTPSPGSVFFRHQPIAVVTAESRRAILAKVDMEDEANKGDEGGGGTGTSTNYRSAFATTAAFMPTIEVGASGATEVEFKLPDNLTAFRLMAVAVSGGNRFGSAESRVTVQKPLMLRPSLPRFLSAGDQFDVRVVVQTVGGRSGEVEVNVAASGPVQLTAGNTQRVSLGPDTIRELSFPAQVGDPGKASFRFKAKGVSGFEGDDAVEWSIPVKYPATTESLNEGGRVTSTGGSGVVWKRLNLPDDVVPSVGGLDIELASSAVAQLLPGLHYLVGYPYGCVEQTTGRTLPLVALGGLVEGIPLPGIDEGQVKTFAQAGLNRLWKMQTYEGGLAYWPGGSTAHPWGSVYGGLALVTAAKSGQFEVDEGRLKRLKNYLRSVLREEVEIPEYWNYKTMDVVKPFAAYVLALAGEPEPSYHETMFNARQEMPHFARGLLAMAILEADGDTTMVQELIDNMLAGAEDNGSEMGLPSIQDDHYWVTMDSDVRSNAIALMTMTRAIPKDPRVERFARGLLKSRVRGRWISTQDNAFAILSLADHIQTTERQEPQYTAIVGLGDNVMLEERFEGRE
ncbi:MAG: alpha-2-macroglobulin family protein, partial [Myxococcota bacterium]